MRFEQRRLPAGPLHRTKLSSYLSLRMGDQQPWAPSVGRRRTTAPGSRPTKKRHAAQRLHDARASGRAWRRRTRHGCGGSAAGGSAAWVADVIRPLLLSPSWGSNCSAGLAGTPKEHAESVDHVGLDSRRDGAVRPAGVARAPGMGRRRGLGRGDIGAVGHPSLACWPFCPSPASSAAPGVGRSSSAVRSPGAASASAIGSRRRSGGVSGSRCTRPPISPIVSTSRSIRQPLGHVRAPGRPPSPPTPVWGPAHPREGGQDQHRCASPGSNGPGHDRADRSQDTVVLTNQVVADFEILAARMRHQARCGDEPMKDLNDELTTLRDRTCELRAQFCTDLAIPLRDTRSRSVRRRSQTSRPVRSSPVRGTRRADALPVERMPVRAAARALRDVGQRQTPRFSPGGRVPVRRGCRRRRCR